MYSSRLKVGITKSKLSHFDRSVYMTKLKIKMKHTLNSDRNFEALTPWGHADKTWKYISSCIYQINITHDPMCLDYNSPHNNGA